MEGNKKVTFCARLSGHCQIARVHGRRVVVSATIEMPLNYSSPQGTIQLM
jgi:hypothetical protein